MEFDEDSFEEGNQNIEVLDETDKIFLEKELNSLNYCITLAKSIKEETKAKNLLIALEQVFENNKKLGANRKALIFTESIRTQEYLKLYLSENGYDKKVVCFNGENSDKESNIIYNRWLQLNACTDRISGNRDLDMKQALVDYFKNDADIMIATESGAEGINLQFCSVVVNYDLPWNPQRVEQRIGRCHRYGQKHDVVVVNFVNTLNYADTRVYELLDQKFKLFDGVFGSSDEVLGAIDSEMELERRINSIYRSCRTRREIEVAFDELQAELDDVIKNRIEKTKISLLENFDEEVIEKLKIRQSKDEKRVNSYNRHFWLLAKSILKDKIEDIDNNRLTFNLTVSINNTIPLGKYILNKENGDLNQLRINHPLGIYIIENGLKTQVDDCQITFKSETEHGRHVYMESFKGEEGYVIIHRVKVSNTCDTHERLIFSSCKSDMTPLPDDFGEKIMELIPCEVNNILPIEHLENLQENYNNQLIALTEQINTQVDEYVNYEIDKFEAWSEDNVFNIQEEVRRLRKEQMELKRQIRHEKKATIKLNLEEEKRKITKALRLKEEKMYNLLNEEDDKVEKMTYKLRESMKNQFQTEEFGRFKWKIQ